MAIKSIPTGSLPYVVVEELPKTGEANTIYGLLDDPEAEFPTMTDYRYANRKWEQVDLSTQVFGFLFNDYQQSVASTISQMEATIAEQEAKILELEEEVFPVVQTNFDMSITSLMQTELDLYDSNDEIVPNMGLSIEVWETPQEITYQNEVRKGTYYLKNADGYALGKSNGEIQPLVCDGTTVDLGSVEVIQVVTGGFEEIEEEAEE